MVNRVITIIIFILLFSKIFFEIFKQQSNAANKINYVLNSSYNQDFKWFIQAGIKDYKLRKKSKQLQLNPLKKFKTLVIYAYYECGEQCKNQLKYFASFGIKKSDYIDYTIVISEKCEICQETDIQKKLQYENVRIIYKLNIGGDFGAYSYGLLMSKNLYLYKYFLFLNDTVIGPFLPKSQIDKLDQWPDIFTSLLNEQTKLVGTSVSTNGPLHIQSFFMALDYIALFLLIKMKIFLHGVNIKEYIIFKGELAITRIILEAGYRINTVLIQYQQYDWNKYWQEGWDQKLFNQGESPTFPLRYGSSRYDVDPYEVIFYKNRGEQRKITDRNGKYLCPNDYCHSDEMLDILTQNMYQIYND